MKTKVGGGTPRAGKGLIRALNRRGTKTAKAHPAQRKLPGHREPAECERCGAVYANKTWRHGRRLTRELMDRAQWTCCPACVQLATGESYGRVIATGDYVRGHLDQIRHRIRNVARLAESRQALRRVVSMNFDGSALEVLTTSQKLAHRIARELEKAFGGRASYSWWDRDGTLRAVWRR
ncbi:MAG: hypothetical protein ACREQF_07340 [Candidatus Binataceae bacterium]